MIIEMNHLEGLINLINKRENLIETRTDLLKARGRNIHQIHDSKIKNQMLFPA